MNIKKWQLENIFDLCFVKDFIFIFAGSYWNEHQNDCSLLTYNIDNRQALSYFIAYSRVSVLASKEKLFHTWE